MKASSAWSVTGAALLFLTMVLMMRRNGEPELPQQANARAAERPPSAANSNATGGDARAAREDAEAVQSSYHLKNIHVEGSWEYNLTRNLIGPFDASELRRVAEDLGRNERRFLELLLRAAADRDSSFRDLIDRPELRKDEQAELGMLTYDYAITGNREALEKIFQLHAASAAKHPTWDSNENMALAVIPEWDRTKQVLLSSHLSGDGSGGDAMYAFWLSRRYLFPKDKSFPQTYEAFSEEMGHGQ